MPNPQNIEKFKMKKGETRNPNGRPKKYITTLKAQGYKLSEINDTIQVMLQLNLEELKEVWANTEATVLEKIIASAIKRSIEDGDLSAIETLITRIYGKPKETSDINLTAQITAVYPKVVQTSIPIATSESEILE